ncbi:hypothetical protein JCM14469_35150 [Desulfatiferula olefinivorans]
MKKHTLSRRSFLKSGALMAGTALAAGLPGRAEGGGRPEPLATLHDLRKCIGCGECVEACRAANEHKFPEPVKPFPAMMPRRVKAEDWSDNQEERDRLTPYNWLFIQEAVVETDEGDLTLYLPRRCMHCVNPPCAKLCPWGAAYQTEQGIAIIDSDLCLGGAKCRDVCPWDIPQRQTGVGLYLDLLPAYAGNGVMFKCDRCADRIAAGGTPACIEACPEGVQIIGPRSDIRRQAYALAEEIGGYVYGDTENGGTNSFYVSPVPFEQINAAIETGPGKPDLSMKKDVMATGNALAAAIFAAPLAGIAAAVGRLYALGRKGGDDEV